MGAGSGFQPGSLVPVGQKLYRCTALHPFYLMTIKCQRKYLGFEPVIQVIMVRWLGFQTSQFCHAEYLVYLFPLLYRGLLNEKCKLFLQNSKDLIDIWKGNFVIFLFLFLFFWRTGMHHLDEYFGAQKYTTWFCCYITFSPYPFYFNFCWKALISNC